MGVERRLEHGVADGVEGDQRHAHPGVDVTPPAQLRPVALTEILHHQRIGRRRRTPDRLSISGPIGDRIRVAGWSADDPRPRRLRGRARPRRRRPAPGSGARSRRHASASPPRATAPHDRSSPNRCSSFRSRIAIANASTCPAAIVTASQGTLEQHEQVARLGPQPGQPALARRQPVIRAHRLRRLRPTLRRQLGRPAHTAHIERIEPTSQLTRLSSASRRPRHDPPRRHQPRATPRGCRPSSPSSSPRCSPPTRGTTGRSNRRRIQPKLVLTILEKGCDSAGEAAMSIGITTRSRRAVPGSSRGSGCGSPRRARTPRAGRRGRRRRACGARSGAASRSPTGRDRARRR